MQTPMIQDAVIRNFEIIGKATKQLSDDLRQANSDIRWQQVAGLRDVLIHGYRSVRLIRIWNIIEQDLPLLKDLVRTLLSTLDDT